MKQILTTLSIIAMMMNLASCEKTCNCNCSCCNQDNGDQTIQRPDDNQGNGGDLNSSPDGIDRSDYVVYNHTMTQGQAGYYGVFYEDQPSTSANWFLELADSNYDLDNYEGTGYNIGIDFFTSSSYTTSIQPGTYEVEPLDATTFSPKKIVSGFITEYEDEEEYYQYPAGTWLFKGDETVGGATAGNMVVSVSGSKYTITYSFHDDDLKVTFTGSYTGNLSIYDGAESYSALAPVKAVKASKSAKLTKHFRVRR